MKTKSLVLMALFVVLEIICTGVLKLNFGVQRITLTFIPYAVAGYMLGSSKGALIAVLADLISFAVFPQGTYFLGFTISAMLSGALYGLLKGKNGKELLVWIIGISIVNAIVMNVVLNTIWLQILLGKSWNALLPVRITKNIISTPFEIVVLMAVFKGLKPLFERGNNNGRNGSNKTRNTTNS